MINLEEANIPLSVESLGDCIFRNDTALTTVTWPENFEAPELVDSDSNTNIYKGRYVPTSMFDGVQIVLPRSVIFCVIYCKISHTAISTNS